MSGRIAVVGGGITGLATALYLLRAGYPVDVLEARAEVGGLSASFDYGPFRWDRFYHCVLTSDLSLLGLLEDLDLTPQVSWTDTEVGFYSHSSLYRMTRPADLLRFPHLSLAGKLRFALGTLYAARLEDGRGLEGVPLGEWVLRVFGAEVAREIWDPLLGCKLGAAQDRASAAFLASTLKRLYSTRGKGAAKQERLGFVRGGYSAILDALVRKIRMLGGRIECGVRLEEVGSANGGAAVRERGRTRVYGAAVLTVPNSAVLGLCPALPAPYRARLAGAEYLAMVCVALVLRRPLSPFYLTNITERSEFTGVVEMTNLIGLGATNGFSLVYLPRYTSADDPLFSASDEEVWRVFERDLARMHPSLGPGDIERRFCFRERAVQPVPTLHYSRDCLPAVETGLPGVFLANTAQIRNDTLNNNAMTGIAKQAARAVVEYLGEQPAGAAREEEYERASRA